MSLWQTANMMNVVGSSRAAPRATAGGWCRSLPRGDFSTGVSCGSFGELLQGVHPDGREFLVTLPIETYAVARFFPDERGEAIEVFPAWKTKSQLLAGDLLRRFGRGIGGRLYLTSEIPCGKGLSSSSADLVATARAIEAYLGIQIPLDELCRSLSRVEPTDGVMFSESVVYFHVAGALCERLGSLPQVKILSLDEGGTVDTLDCHSRGASRKPSGECGAMLERLRDGFRRNALADIGAVSTRSAAINQAANPKRHFERVQSICDRTGGAGVVTTHSGTCLGILYDATRPGHADDLARAAAEMRGYGKVDVYATVHRPIEPACGLDRGRFHQA